MLKLSAVALATLMALSCDSAPEASKPQPDSTPGPGSLSFPDTAAGEALSSHLETMVAVGPNAEANYQASMTRLRQEGPQVVTLLAQTYDATDKASYSNRWALVETLAELRAPEARDPLIRIAHETIPPRSKGVPHAFDQECVIRMTASRGLGYLAVSDDTAARELGRLAQHPLASLHGEARRALANVIQQEKDKRRQAFLIALVPNWDYTQWLPIRQPPPRPPR